MTEQEILRATYYDSCDVYRRECTKDPETRQMVQKENCVLQNIPCALSQDKGREISFSGGYGKTTGEYTLFCDPKTPIKAGDKVRITTSLGEVYVLWAGKPFGYARSHAEIPLSEEERSK